MTKLNRINLIRNKYTGIKVDIVMMRALLVSNYGNWKQNISTRLNDVTNIQAMHTFRSDAQRFSNFICNHLFIII